MHDDTFQALVGERSFEIVLQDGDVLLDGEPIDCAFERLSTRSYLLLLNNRSVPVVVERSSDHEWLVTLANRQVKVRVKDEKALLLERFGLAETAAAAELEVRAPMPGLVLEVNVETSQAVEEGQGLLVLEAMKMENELHAPADGVVKAIHAYPGDAVDKSELLVELEYPS